MTIFVQFYNLLNNKRHYLCLQGKYATFIKRAQRTERELETFHMSLIYLMCVVSLTGDSK